MLENTILKQIIGIDIAKDLIYSDFDVVLNNSGNRKGKTSISKKVDKYLRKVVFMPAFSAEQHNQKMKELYKRLVQKGKNKKLALINSFLFFLKV